MGGGDVTRNKLRQRHNLSHSEVRVYQYLHHRYNMTPKEVLEEIKLRNQRDIERNKELEEIFGLRI